MLNCGDCESAESIQIIITIHKTLKATIFEKGKQSRKTQVNTIEIDKNFLTNSIESAY